MLLPRHPSSIWHFRILAYMHTLIYTRVHTYADTWHVYMCKLAFRQACFAVVYKYTAHIPFADKGQRRQGLSAARIRIETDRLSPRYESGGSAYYLRTSPFVTAKATRWRPDSGYVRFRKISMCRRNFQVRSTRLSGEFRFSMTERIFRRCIASD